jgi:malate dehydrogenase (oxaloacetate-decarboxylating)
MQKMTVEDLKKKAEQPGIDAMKLHPFYRGKCEIVPKCKISSFDDFAIWYTPGVAKPCLDIRDHPEKVFEHTNKGNFVAVVSDGTRVLGLGNIGPEAGLPVMEGKAILFKYLGGVDAFPICIATKDPDEIITLVKWIQPTFGGINLEDIEKPKCFYILDTLRSDPALKIPVWHDDQQGTAAITLAGLINAVKIVGKEMGKVKISMIGSGASNVAIERIITAAGVEPKNVMMVDTRGILHKGRDDLKGDPTKWHLVETTNGENRQGGIPEALKGADVCIALSKSGPGVILPEWVAAMAKNSIVFTCANPVPEIWPWEAKEAGAKIVATGRSDFANQVNNSLGFPGIFRGTLDVMATTITDEMCIAASREIAKCAEDRGLSEEYIVPTMDDWEVFPREATAVGLKAIEQGVARIKLTREQLMKTASDTIKRAREETQFLMDEGFIKIPGVPAKPRSARPKSVVKPSPARRKSAKPKRAAVKPKPKSAKPKPARTKRSKSRSGRRGK